MAEDDASANGTVVEVLPYHGSRPWDVENGLVPRSKTALGTQGAPIKELSPDREPWERQPRESLKAWSAFTSYRDQGTERSLRLLAASLGKSLTLVGRWSRHWLWQERVSLWEAHQDRLARKALEDALRMVAVKRMDISMQMLNVVSSSLRAITPEGMEQLRPWEVSALAKAAQGLTDHIPGLIGAPEQPKGMGSFEEVVLAMSRRLAPPNQLTD